MNFWKKTALAATVAALGGTTATAGCGIPGGAVKFLGNDFAAIHDVTDQAKACAGDGVTVDVNLTTQHDKLQVAALTANPAQYTAVHVTNSSIVPLLNEGLLRPLDDLVAKYGKDLQKSQLITINGHVMAVAFMANAQHLYYRKDILAKVGVKPPKTYAEVVAAAKKIEAAGIMPHPFAMNSKAGWNLGEEFVNMYLGEGGSFFKPGTADVAINNDQGVAALKMLKQLTELSGPDYLTYDSNATSALWEQGNIALAELWGSRGAGILEGKNSTKEIVSNTVLAAAPTVGGGNIPASTLWWDGFAIAKNISDKDAEASFRAMVHGISPAILKDHSGDAVWLIKGYQPTPAAAGVAATAKDRAKPYPMVPYMGLLHTALGNNLADYLQGKATATETLSNVEAAYTAAAKQKGFLK